MTTIVFTRQMLAFDSQITFGQTPHTTVEDKVVYVDGVFYGVSGVATNAEAVRYVQSNFDPASAPEKDEEDGWTIMFATRDDLDENTAYVISDKYGVPVKVYLPYGIGSGSLAALGALAALDQAGVEPYDDTRRLEIAMQVAASQDIYTDNNFGYIHIPEEGPLECDELTYADLVLDMCPRSEVRPWGLWTILKGWFA